MQVEIVISHTEYQKYVLVSLCSMNASRGYTVQGNVPCSMYIYHKHHQTFSARMFFFLRGIPASIFADSE